MSVNLETVEALRQVAQVARRFDAQQAACGTFRSGMLRNQFRREDVIEVGKLHPSIII